MIVGRTANNEMVVRSHVGQTLFSIVEETRDYPPETLFEFNNGPYVKRSDGTTGMFQIELGRLREEAWIRMCFPHDAETRVY